MQGDAGAGGEAGGVSERELSGFVRTSNWGMKDRQCNRLDRVAADAHSGQQGTETEKEKEKERRFQLEQGRCRTPVRFGSK